MNKNKRINIVGLAQKLGLSVSSVSRALNGYDNISQSTKDKIFRTAKKYNYFPDLNAKRLASKKNDTIAFISAIDPDAPDHVVLQFLAGITLGIKKTNTELITKFCLKKYKINKKNILGHSDIAPLRKIDPGEKFPWKFLNKKKIGIWHNANSKKLKSLRKKNSKENLSEFINYLKKVGYNIEYSNLKELKKIIKVFQMRFRPELVNGKFDLECFNIAKSLKNTK